MKTISNPNPALWETLCARPSMDTESLRGSVQELMQRVERGGDAILKELTSTFDKVSLDHLQVRKAELEAARVSSELSAAIEVARTNIERFHQAQRQPAEVVETMSGVKCWRRGVAIQRVGLYIPGGSAPLFSTVLMLGIPAKLAGCKEIVLCTPPNDQGEIHPAILYCARILGITKVFKLGGAQAIAALTYGTESVPRVDKIFGPGNQYVTMAKMLAQQSGVAIDMPAGPSELLVIADRTCVPRYVAADLLSQSEHGKDSQVVLLSDSRLVIEAVQRELELQIDKLPRADLARQALKNSIAVELGSVEDCMRFSNTYSPEHLILVTGKNDLLQEQLINAGSVFLGNFSCESAGDYASGTNHTLPTSGFASAYSGVSLDSFLKQITFQEISPIGLQNIGPSIECMAETEQLYAHKNAVSIRLSDLENI